MTFDAASLTLTVDLNQFTKSTIAVNTQLEIVLTDPNNLETKFKLNVKIEPAVSDEQSINGNGKGGGSGSFSGVSFENDTSTTK